MMYLGIVLLYLAVVPGSFCNEDIHKYMSPEEVLRVFHTDHDSVPKYEIVKVHLSKRLHKRDLPAESEMHIKAFGENINLWLHPRQSVLAGRNTPVYFARFSRNETKRVKYTLGDGLMEKVGRIFEDAYRLAFLVIGKERSGRITVNGYIESKGIAVRSLPPRVAEEYRRRRRSVGDLDDFNSPYHVVFETLKSYEGNDPVLPVNVEALQQRASQNASEIKNILYPEILVVVEHSIRRAYGSDINGLLQYILAFWNGVDLKFRSLMAPRVRLYISYIVLAEDRHATPYIAKYALNDNAFNSSAAVYTATGFFHGVKGTFPLSSYDISVTMTLQKLDIDGATFGQSWLGTACLNDVQNRTWAVALIHDNAAFHGVFTAAHELGHLFGAKHDTGNCVMTDGFIMSNYALRTKNSSDFSTCSLESFRTHLKNSELDCLRNPPCNQGRSLPRLMPGRIKNLEKQCKVLKLGAPCEDKSKPTDVCVNFYCLDKNNNCKQTGVAALDGTSCEKGSDKFCLHMRCVSL